MADHFFIEDLHIFVIKPEPVILGIAVPVLKLYHEVYSLRILDALNTVETLYIDDSDSSKFYQIFGYSRRSSNQGIVIYLPYLHDIICNKAVSTSHELKRSF